MRGGDPPPSGAVKPASRPLPAPVPVVRLLPELADYAAGWYGDSPFLLRRQEGDWRGYSFAEAARAAHAFAGFLSDRGIEPGDRVGLLSENRPEWGIAYLAILDAGAVVVPLDPQLTAPEVGEILATAGARRCVAGRRQVEVLEEVRRTRLSELDRIGLESLVELPTRNEARRAEAPWRAAPANPADLAVLLFTSGTTGQAKGVMLSHSNLLHNVESVVTALHIGRGDRFLSVLPLHHTFEATAGFLCPLRAGASVAYARSLKSSELREDLKSSGATIVLGVPLLYEKLLGGIARGIEEAPRPQRALATGSRSLAGWIRRATGARPGRWLLGWLRARAGLGRLRAVVSGAAPLPPEVFWGFVDLGLPLLEGYGLTECSPVVAVNRPEHPLQGTVGWPIPGVEVRIDEPQSDGSGEIVVRGPNVMLGYFGNPAATAEALRDGWFHTGDLGHMAGDGSVRITGRLKNMIATSAGKKIYPEEVELALSGSPHVLEVVVVAGRDPRGEREEVHAHIFPNRETLGALAKQSGRPCDDAFVEEALRQEVELRCRDLAPFKRVKRVIVRREEFSRTPTGKIKRQGIGTEEEGARAVASRASATP